jgi:hypothetical protein
VGSQSDPEVSARDRRAQRMRDYRARNPDTSRERANQARQERARAVEILIHRHEGEFERILTDIRNRRES